MTCVPFALAGRSVRRQLRAELRVFAPWRA
jgi:hypothetical protein